MLLDIALTIGIVCVCLIIVLVFILLLWYIVWELFLKNFKFVQEVLGKKE